MDDKKQLSIQLDKARQEEIKACNEMYSYKQKIKQQKHQLDSCLQCRQECQDNMKSAKSSGLTILQVRECQLLVQHLNTVVETHLYKIKLCENNYDKSKLSSQEKSEDYLDLKEKFDRLVADEENDIDKLMIKNR